MKLKKWNIRPAESEEVNEVQKERTEELNQLHIKKHLIGFVEGRLIFWACDESRLTEGFCKIYLIDGNTAVHAMKDIEGAPITQELLQKIIDDYIEYYAGTYLKYGCMLVNAYGRPRLYDDEREEQYGKSRN